MNATTRTSTDFISRARSSRRWSDERHPAVGADGVLGGAAEQSETAEMADNGAPDRRCRRDAGVSWLRVELGRCAARRARGPRSRAAPGLRAPGVRRGVVVVVHQALGLGLEDAQGPAAAAGELGKLGGTEEEDQHSQDDEQLSGAESGDRAGSCTVLTWVGRDFFLHMYALGQS